MRNVYNATDLMSAADAAYHSRGRCSFRTGQNAHYRALSRLLTAATMSPSRHHRRSVELDMQTVFQHSTMTGRVRHISTRSIWCLQKERL